MGVLATIVGTTSAVLAVSSGISIGVGRYLPFYLKNVLKALKIPTKPFFFTAQNRIIVLNAIAQVGLLIGWAIAAIAYFISTQTGWIQFTLKQLEVFSERVVYTFLGVWSIFAILIFLVWFLHVLFGLCRKFWIVGEEETAKYLEEDTLSVDKKRSRGFLAGMHREKRKLDHEEENPKK